MTTSKDVNVSNEASRSGAPGTRLVLPRPNDVEIVVPSGWSATDAVQADVVLIGPGASSFRPNITVARQRISAVHTLAEIVAQTAQGLAARSGVSIVSERPCTIDGVEAIDHRFRRTIDGQPTLDGRQVVVMFPIGAGRQVRDLIVITALVPIDAPSPTKDGVDELVASVRVQPLS
jgi:hypothetical protein